LKFKTDFHSVDMNWGGGRTPSSRQFQHYLGYVLSSGICYFGVHLYGATIVHCVTISRPTTRYLFRLM